MYQIQSLPGKRNSRLRLFVGALVLAWLFSAGHVFAQTRQKPVPLFSWYGDYKNSNTVIVFVHGIFGDNNTFLYQADKGSEGDRFWPDLVIADSTIGAASIFMGGFYTSPTSRDYATDQATADLFAALRTPDPKTKRAVIDHKNIIFVAHSTGGIVARSLLFENQRWFKNKNVGLVLIASPSLGSRWADRLSPIANLAGNQLAKELEDGSVFLTQLDKNFKNLLANGVVKIDGIEASENHFVINCFFCLSKVVEVSSAARYFPNPRMLWNTDHFSSVKPDSSSHPAHKLLVEFYRDHFLTKTTQHDVSPPIGAVVKIRTQTRAWAPVSDAEAPFTTRVSIAVAPSVCATAADDSPPNKNCTLRLVAPSRNPLQLGDYRLNNIKIKCVGASKTCSQFNRNRFDTTRENSVISTEVSLRASESPSGSSGDDASAVPATWELTADLSQLRLDSANAKLAERKVAYGEVVEVPVSKNGEVVSIEARLLDSTSQINAGENSPDYGLVLLESMDRGDEVRHRYRIGRP